MAQLIDPKVLADGGLLRHLKHEFLLKQNETTLLAVLHCLRDSKVLVPLKAVLSQEEQERVKKAKEGEKVTIDHDIEVEPDILVNGGKKWLPIFSSSNQLPQEYAVHFTLAELSVFECIEMLHGFKGVDGLVLDAFTEAMLIEKKNAELLSKFKSRLTTEN